MTNHPAAAPMLAAVFFIASPMTLAARLTDLVIPASADVAVATEIASWVIVIGAVAPMATITVKIRCLIMIAIITNLSIIGVERLRLFCSGLTAAARPIYELPSAGSLRRTDQFLIWLSEYSG